MKPCNKCRHLTGALAWMKKKGAPIGWVPLCPNCLDQADAEEDKERKR